MFKMDRQKILPTLLDMKNTQLEIKPIKTGLTYCSGYTRRSKNHK